MATGYTLSLDSINKLKTTIKKVDTLSEKLTISDAAKAYIGQKQSWWVARITGENPDMPGTYEWCHVTSIDGVYVDLPKKYSGRYNAIGLNGSIGLYSPLESDSQSQQNLVLMSFMGLASPNSSGDNSSGVWFIFVDFTSSSIFNFIVESDKGDYVDGYLFSPISGNIGPLTNVAKPFDFRNHESDYEVGGNGNIHIAYEYITYEGELIRQKTITNSGESGGGDSDDYVQVTHQEINEPYLFGHILSIATISPGTGVMSQDSSSSSSEIVFQDINDSGRHWRDISFLCQNNFLALTVNGPYVGLENTTISWLDEPLNNVCFNIKRMSHQNIDIESGCEASDDDTVDIVTDVSCTGSSVISVTTLKIPAFLVVEESS